MGAGSLRKEAESLREVRHGRDGLKEGWGGEWARKGLAWVKISDYQGATKVASPAGNR